MPKCLDAVCTKQLAQRESSRAFHIPRRTKCYRLPGKYLNIIGRLNAFFFPDEESNYVRNLMAMRDFGFLTDPTDLCYIIKSYLNQIGWHIQIFPNNLSGKF